jgi:hypothetical protein
LKFLVNGIEAAYRLTLDIIWLMAALFEGLKIARCGGQALHDLIVIPLKTGMSYFTID